jgi:hypothetical protein
METKEAKHSRRIVLCFYFGSCALMPLRLCAQAPVSSGTVITIAGNGSYDFSGDGGPATNASIRGVYGLAVGPDGTLFLSDYQNYRIRAVNPTNGVITTMCGNGAYGTSGDGGAATNASIHDTRFLTVDAQRGALYLTDGSNVRKVTLATGIITNFAGSGLIDPYPVGEGYGDGRPATEAWFESPSGVAVGSFNNLFIADLYRSNVRKVSGTTGIISTIAGVEEQPGVPSTTHSGDRGPAVGAGLDLPYSLAADRAGNVFILEGESNRVRRIDAVSGIITTVAGGGTNVDYSGVATNVDLTYSRAIAVDNSGGLFISVPNQVLKVDLATGLLTVFAGTGETGFSGDGGPALNARFWEVWTLAVAPGGGLLVADETNERVRYIAPDSINLTNDNGQTAFYLPWVSALTGHFTVANNSSLTNLVLGSLTAVSGNIGVNGNTAVGTIDLSSLVSVGSVAISGNVSATTINVGSLQSATGSVTIGNNVAVGTVDLASLQSVTGSVSIENNNTAGTVALGSLTTSGSIGVNGNGSAGSVDLGSLVAVTGSVTIANNASATNVDLDSLGSIGGDLTIVSNSANAVVELNSLTTFGNDTNETTLTLDGTVSVTNGLTLETNATLAGSSTLDGSVTNNGTISPGASPGRIDITGNLKLANTSRMHLELGGFAAGQFDRINVAQSVTLGGALSVRLINHFTSMMTNGASFTLLTAGSPFIGAFANIADGGTLVTSDGYARFTVHYAGTSTLRLTDLAIVDTDNDGLPDWWEDQFGLNKTNPSDAALDLDADGASNRDEFLAGTDPSNAASAFHIVSIAPDTGNVRLTWTTVGGKSYVVQTKAPLPDGNFTSSFADLGPLITMPGIGESTTNFMDVTAPTNGPARYYRVRLVP